MPAPRALRFSFSRESYSQARIRELIANAASNVAGFTERQRDRICSVIDELCQNAFEHGSMPGAEIGVEIIFRDDEIEILVEDRGKDGALPAAEVEELFNKRRQEDPTASTSKRGRGLPRIVANWTDSVFFEDRDGGGLQVRVIKKF